MNPKHAIKNRLTAEERAVSPVIGVILMVAITVILAAVIGTFVLDLGQSTGNAAPQVSFGIQDHSDNYDPTASGSNAIRMTHSSGEELDVSTTDVIVRNATTGSVIVEVASGSYAVGSGEIAVLVNGNDITGVSSLSTGDVLVIQDTNTAGNFTDGNDYTVQIIDGNSDKTVAESTVQVQ